ncbi:MAG: 4-hydroxyphenylacetate 3-monooxygenase [Alphaproteobacteria bacterium]|nr:MAG: 4-hydroxyphenylacetate 3-monooxygenase [Alphaproteobacteria bacterium]
MERRANVLDRTGRPSAVSPRDYRDAMSRFAGAVHVVTTDGAAGRRGVTVLAVVSVSDDPPTLVVCLNRNRAENTWFAENGCFAINTLCGDQIDLARAFAGEGGLTMDRRFALGRWSRLVTGAPVLEGARMVLDCRLVDVRPVHTHYVMFGEVVGVGASARGAALLYLDRDYRSL